MPPTDRKERAIRFAFDECIGRESVEVLTEDVAGRKGLAFDGCMGRKVVEALTEDMADRKDLLLMGVWGGGQWML